MAFLVEDKDRLMCNMCNKVVTQLVPLYDNDQKHEKTMCCVFCKRAIRNNKPIKKFKRDPEEIKKFVEETNKKLNEMQMRPKNDKRKSESKNKR